MHSAPCRSRARISRSSRRRRARATSDSRMHILITGAAGMVGRKLTDRLIADGGLAGKPVEKLTLVDVVAPKAPAAFSGKVEAYALDVSREDAGRKLVSSRPDAIF